MTRDVLVLLGHRDGVPDPANHGVIEQGRSLAEAVGSQLRGLLLCDEPAALLEPFARSGLETVHTVQDRALASYSPEAYSRTATEAVRRLMPGLLLCAHGFDGMEVAPWVAARLRAPLLSNCVALECVGDALFGERLVYGQAWQVRVRVPWQQTVVATLARGAAAQPKTGFRPPRVEPLDVEPGTLGIRTRVREIRRPVGEEIDLARADLVVGIGRGIRDPENLTIVEALARELGGVLACSRPIVDLEWMPYERQVGISGRSIRPRVYIACGISGAAQHLAGITDAQTIVAINQDANAPIFRVAHHGAVADLLRVVPALTAEARRRGSGTTASPPREG